MSQTVKVKEPSVVRTYDQDGFRKRAACICVNDDESRVLLVTSRKDANQWIVPGGGVEPEEAVQTAAIREVREEAGVNGDLGRCLGVFENAERGHRTSVYVLVVTEELDDWDESRTFGRQRRWFTVEAAVGALHKPLQSSYVRLLLPPDHPLYHATPRQLCYTPAGLDTDNSSNSRHNCSTSRASATPPSTLRSDATTTEPVVVGNGTAKQVVVGNGTAEAPVGNGQVAAEVAKGDGEAASEVVGNGTPTDVITGGKIINNSDDSSSAAADMSCNSEESDHTEGAAAGAGHPQQCMSNNTTSSSISTG
uniref:diphosphoinositol-polyphosphate diphosphatase n=1 Tax=Hirondellea gigas TaxID=1518452 RepID=A0A2P2I3K2_9CRUS